MQEKFKKAIEENYNIHIEKCVEAARGMIAETFILNDRYFCKLVAKPLIIKYILESLPLVEALQQAGIDQINHLVKPQSGYYVRVDDTIIILSVYLNAVSTRDYDAGQFGALLAKIHAVHPSVSNPCESFDTSFTNVIGEIQESPAVDSIGVELQKTLLLHGDDMRRHLDAFRHLAGVLRHSEKTRLSITHGDVQGNVMITPSNELFIVDWDEAILAPRERDLWLLSESPTFMEGYGKDHILNKSALDYYACNAYFVSTTFRIEDVLRQSDSEVKRRDTLQNLALRISPKGWMRKRLDAISG